MRRSWMPALFAVALLTPATAFAEPPSACPPGGWFCADPDTDTPVKPDISDDTTDDTPVLPKAKPQQLPPADDTPGIDPDRGPVRRPRVIVVDQNGGYATPPPNVVIVTQQTQRAHPRYYPAPMLQPPSSLQRPTLYTGGASGSAPRERSWATAPRATRAWAASA